MIAEIFVGLDFVHNPHYIRRELTEFLEQTFVITTVEAHEILIKVFPLVELNVGLWRVNDFLFQICSAEEDDASQHNIKDQLFI